MLLENRVATVCFLLLPLRCSSYNERALLESIRVFGYKNYTQE